MFGQQPDYNIYKANNGWVVEIPRVLHEWTPESLVDAGKKIHSSRDELLEGIYSENEKRDEKKVGLFVFNTYPEMEMFLKRYFAHD